MCPSRVSALLAPCPPLAPASIDFTAPAHEVARRLIGVTLLVDGVGGRIVETEAYDQTDPASHTFGGPTARNAAMFGPPGCAYVYRSYGLHWCINTVCREAGHGAGVLLRALEPTHGVDAMRARRGLQDPRVLCAGPGRLAQALGIDAGFNGRPLALPPFALLEPDSTAAEFSQPIDVVAGPRIGISKAVEVPWRFGLRGSRYLSRGFADAPQGVAVATVAPGVTPGSGARRRAQRPG
jgi:DNA-3-methyladenine glycosylase